MIAEFTRPDPLINFRLLDGANFGFGTMGNFLLGFACMARRICCRSILPTRKATVRSRSAR